MVDPVVLSALDGLMLRQQVTAQNLANLNTPGYTPLRVEFEAALRQAAAGDRLPDKAVIKAQAQTGDEASPTAALSQEVAVLADTVMRYQTLIKGINKHLGLLQLAISEGRR